MSAFRPKVVIDKLGRAVVQRALQQLPICYRIAMNGLSVKGLVHELRRRHTFRTAGLYIVGAWLVMQAADVFFPAWGLPEAAINVLLATAILGFPLALVFGWFYDITADGIVRTPAVGAEDVHDPLPLQRKDFVLLGALGLIGAYIIYGGVQDIVRAPRVGPTEEVLAHDLREKLENSIAVLPFANISNDPGNAYFCDGVAEEIRGRLAHFSELNVIGRTSSEAFKGRNLPVEQLTQLLGVHYVLDGSVRKAGKQLRVTASLLDESGVQVWSESFDRQLQDVFSIQSEIADTVAKTIYPKVVPTATKYESPALSAFDHFLRGRELVHRRSRAAALEELARALEIDPEYPEALAEYAIALALSFPSDAETEMARQAIDKALELRPGMARALAAKGLLTSQQPEHAERAETFLRQALASDPSMSDASNWLAGVLGQQGLDDEESEVRRRAYRIDPLHPAIAANYANQLRQRGEFERAQQVSLRLIEADAKSLYPYYDLVDDFERRGRLVEMLHMAQRAALSGASTEYWKIARAYALLGDFESAEYWVKRTRRDFPNWAGSRYLAALFRNWQGQYDDAAAEHEAALEEQGLVLEEQHVWIAHGLGWAQALAGSYREAISTLERIPMSRHTSPISLHAQQALAWAYLQTGRREKAVPILQQLDDYFREEERKGRLAVGHTPNNSETYLYALNTRMLGDNDRALDLLQNAIDGGWRNYYICHHDPRWDAVREKPQFQRMMTAVKADVDAQRAQLEQEEEPEDFVKRLDRVRAAESATDQY